MVYVAGKIWFVTIAVHIHYTIIKPTKC